MKQTENQFILDGSYKNQFWKWTRPLLHLPSTGRWLVKGAWAWLTLKPQSRPWRWIVSNIHRGGPFIILRLLNKVRVCLVGLEFSIVNVFSAYQRQRRRHSCSSSHVHDTYQKLLRAVQSQQDHPHA